MTSEFEKYRADSTANSKYSAGHSLIGSDVSFKCLSRSRQSDSRHTYYRTNHIKHPWVVAFFEMGCVI